MAASLAWMIGTQSNRVRLVGTPEHLPPPLHARLDDEIETASATTILANSYGQLTEIG